MDESQLMEAVEDLEDGMEGGGEERVEESMPMPFGIMGAAFLCNVLQYAVFLGLTMLLLMIFRYFGPS